jgi:hypothetical protein
MVRNINEWLVKSPFERGDLFEMNQSRMKNAAAEKQDG